MYNWKPITLANFVATIEGFPDHRFTEVSGLSQNRSVVTVYDGYSEHPRQLLSSAESGEVTLRKPYDPDFDAPLVQFIQNFSHSDKPLTISVTPTRFGNNQETSGVTINAYECIPIGITHPDFNASSVSDVAMLEIRFTRRMILSN